MVAFKAQSNLQADSAVIGCPIHLAQHLDSAKAWLGGRLATNIPDKPVIWWVFDPDLETVLGATDDAANMDSLQSIATGLPLHEAPLPLADFLDALAPVFKKQ